MVQLETHMGMIEINNHYFAGVIGRALERCFGVKGLVGIMPAGRMRTLLKGAGVRDDGVRVRESGGSLVIDTYLSVAYGVALEGLTDKVVKRVAEAVENACGMHVVRVNVYVAGIQAE